MPEPQSGLLIGLTPGCRLFGTAGEFQHHSGVLDDHGAAVRRDPLEITRYFLVPGYARPEDDIDDRRKEACSCPGASHQTHHRDSAAATVTAARSPPGTAACYGAGQLRAVAEAAAPGETVNDDPASHAWCPYAEEFPCWHIWRGISGLAYARLSRSSPPIVVRAEGATELRNKIRRAESTLSMPAARNGR